MEACCKKKLYFLQCVLGVILMDGVLWEHTAKDESESPSCVCIFRSPTVSRLIEIKEVRCGAKGPVCVCSTQICQMDFISVNEANCHFSENLVL